MFKGLDSKNKYSQYYCINKLVEYYNDEDIRIKAIAKIKPFLEDKNIKLKEGAKFAIAVLDKNLKINLLQKLMKRLRYFPYLIITQTMEAIMSCG